MAKEIQLRVYRGDDSQGEMQDHRVEVDEGMVVLDAVHRLQAEAVPDLAVRWNCKAGKCGSCSAEVNGRPKLMCMTRLDDLDLSRPVTIRPMQAFPVIKDLVTDVSWNYEVKKRIPPLDPHPDAEWRMQQEDVDRIQEFRKCIECFLCQDVCHVLRNHDKKPAFIGPRFLIYVAGMEMHPMDRGDRLPALKDEYGVGFCNINRCCTEVCPESINITDNGIIPLKERVVDRYYDPLTRLFRMFTGKKASTG